MSSNLISTIVVLAVLPITAVLCIENCYVGVSIKLGNQGSSIQIGGFPMPCTTKCSNTTLYGLLIVYACDPTQLCDTFNINNRCDPEGANVIGCCCDTADNCNYPGVPPTLAPGVTLPPPIQCYNGLVSPTYTSSIGAVMPCEGDCANLTDGTTTLFICDPVSVCQSLNVINRCQNIDDLGFVNGTGIQACCCGTNYCSSPALFATGTPSLPTTLTTTTAAPMTTGAMTTTSSAITVIASTIAYCFGRYFNSL